MATESLTQKRHDKNNSIAPNSSCSPAKHCSTQFTFRFHMVLVNLLWWGSGGGTFGQPRGWRVG